MSAREDEFFFRLGRVLDAPREWQDDEALGLFGKHWQPMAELAGEQP